MEDRPIAWKKLRTSQLPDNESEDDETNVIARHKNSGTAPVTQTIKFTDLPAELRNRIYELALPSEEEDLITATPFKDELMALGSQLALTRTCRTIRAEALPMFYAKARFVAYIDDMDFTGLAAWCHAVSPTLKTFPSAMRPIQVHVKMLVRFKSTEDILKMMRIWSRVPFADFHLLVHACGHGIKRFPEAVNLKAVVVGAIRIAEDAAQRDAHEELDSYNQYVDTPANRFLNKVCGNMSSYFAASC